MIAKESDSRSFIVAMRVLDSPILRVLDLVYRKYGYYFYPGNPTREENILVFPVHGIVPIPIYDAVAKEERRFSYRFESLGFIKINQDTLKILESPTIYNVRDMMKASRESSWIDIRRKLLLVAPAQFGKSVLIQHSLTPVRTIAEAVLRNDRIFTEEVRKPVYLSFMLQSGLLTRTAKDTYEPGRRLIDIYEKYSKDMTTVTYFAVGLTLADNYEQLISRGIFNMRPWTDLSTSYYEKAIGCEELISIERREFLNMFLAERRVSRWKRLRYNSLLTGLQMSGVLENTKNVVGVDAIFQKVKGLRDALPMIT